MPQHFGRRRLLDALGLTQRQQEIVATLVFGCLTLANACHIQSQNLSLPGTHRGALKTIDAILH